MTGVSLPAAASAYAGTRVLVTGATGFIASHVIEALNRAGARVTGVARRRPARAMPGCSSFHSVDLSSIDACRTLLQAACPDHVFHLSSHVTGRQDTGTVLETLRGNLIATVNLLTALADEGSPRSIVLAGSSEEPRSFSLADANSAPSSPYAAAKLAGSAYGAFFRLNFRLPVTHARIFMVYGPGQRDLAKLVPHVATQLLLGKTPSLSSGRRRADWVFVEDAAAGILALGLRPDVTSAEIGTGQLTSVAAIALRLRDLIAPESDVGLGAMSDRLNETERVADSAEAERLMGWRPKVSLEEGLRRTVEWYRKELPSLLATS